MLRLYQFREQFPNYADKVLLIRLQRIRLAAGLKVAVQHDQRHHDPGLLRAKDLASKLGIPVNWLYVQIGKKSLPIDRQTSGARLISSASSVLNAVSSLRNHTISSLDPRSCQ